MIRELDGVQDVALPSEEDERDRSSPVAWLSHHIGWMLIQLGDGISCNCNQHCNAFAEPTTHQHDPRRRGCCIHKRCGELKRLNHRATKHDSPLYREHSLLVRWTHALSEEQRMDG